jgi:hypothetical protein
VIIFRCSFAHYRAKYREPTMSARDAFSLLFVFILVLTGLSAIAAASQTPFAGTAMQVQSAGFDAFANQMFGGNDAFGSRE